MENKPLGEQGGLKLPLFFTSQKLQQPQQDLAEWFARYAEYFEESMWLLQQRFLRKWIRSKSKVSRQQMEQACEVQQRAFSAGHKIHIGEILLQIYLLQKRDLEKLLRKSGSEVLACPTCNLHFFQEASHQVESLCPKCQRALPKAETDEVLLTNALRTSLLGPRLLSPKNNQVTATFLFIDASEHLGQSLPKLEQEAWGVFQSFRGWIDISEWGDEAQETEKNSSAITRRITKTLTIVNPRQVGSPVLSLFWGYIRNLRELFWVIQQRMFAQMCITSGILPEKKVERGIEIQKRALQEGKLLPLGKALLRLYYLKQEELLQVQNHIWASVWECHQCNLSWFKPFARDFHGQCPHCQQQLTRGNYSDKTLDSVLHWQSLPVSLLPTDAQQRFLFFVDSKDGILDFSVTTNDVLFAFTPHRDANEVADGDDEMATGDEYSEQHRDDEDEKDPVVIVDDDEEEDDGREYDPIGDFDALLGKEKDDSSVVDMSDDIEEYEPPRDIGVLLGDTAKSDLDAYIDGDEQYAGSVTDEYEPPRDFSALIGGEDSSSVSPIETVYEDSSDDDDPSSASQIETTVEDTSNSEKDSDSFSPIETVYEDASSDNEDPDSFSQIETICEDGSDNETSPGSVSAIETIYEDASSDDEDPDSLSQIETICEDGSDNETGPGSVSQIETILEDSPSEDPDSLSQIETICEDGSDNEADPGSVSAIETIYEDNSGDDDPDSLSQIETICEDGSDSDRDPSVSQIETLYEDNSDNEDPGSVPQVENEIESYMDIDEISDEVDEIEEMASYAHMEEIDEKEADDSTTPINQGDDAIGEIEEDQDAIAEEIDDEQVESKIGLIEASNEQIEEIEDSQDFDALSEMENTTTEDRDSGIWDEGERAVTAHLHPEDAPRDIDEERPVTACLADSPIADSKSLPGDSVETFPGESENKLEKLGELIEVFVESSESGTEEERAATAAQIHEFMDSVLQWRSDESIYDSYFDAKGLEVSTEKELKKFLRSRAVRGDQSLAAKIEDFMKSFDRRPHQYREGRTKEPSDAKVTRPSRRRKRFAKGVLSTRQQLAILAALLLSGLLAFFMTLPFAETTEEDPPETVSTERRQPRQQQQQQPVEIPVEPDEETQQQEQPVDDPIVEQEPKEIPETNSAVQKLLALGDPEQIARELAKLVNSKSLSEADFPFIQQLYYQYTSQKIRNLCIWSAGIIRGQAAKEWLDKLVVESSEPRERTMAIAVLEELGDDKSKKILLRILRESADGEMAISSAFALSKLAPKDEAVYQELTSKFYQASEDKVRKNLLFAIASTKQSNVSSFLVDVANNNLYGSSLRIKAIEALTIYALDNKETKAQVKNLLSPLLNADDPGLRNKVKATIALFSQGQR